MLIENIAKFLEYYQSLSYSDKSLKALKSRLGEFNDYVNRFGVKSISEIEYSHLLEFVSGDEQTSAHVTKSRVWALRRFFRYLMSQGILPHNPAADLSYPKLEKQVPQFLSAGDFERILDFLSERILEADGLRNLLLFLFLGVLGLRISTIRQLNIADVDVASGRLWVNEKGGVQRFMILSPTLVYFLDCYLATLPDSPEALFLSKRGKRISERALQTLVAEIGQFCGLSNRLHPHLFRHTAATHLCQVAEVNVTREVLGHWRESTTRRYIHLSSNRYAQYMRRHPYMREWQNA
jgi:integrase/recombinase XerC